MITKNDCLTLLFDMRNKGINCNDMINKTVGLTEPTVEIIKFINDNRELELYQFYEKIRKSYNQKRSNLYRNIVKEIEEPDEVLTTLSAMETQILIFSKTCNDKQMFLRHSRAEEISYVLNNYFKTYDITNAIKLLRLIKADLKVLEYINGKNV